MRTKLAILVLFLAAAFGITGPKAVDVVQPRLVVTQVPFKSSSERAKHWSLQKHLDSRKGSRIVTVAPGGEVRVLTPEFDSASDPNLSFDARRMVFAGKRSSRDNWDIWEMDVDGRNKRQIVKNFGNCRDPRYLAPSSITPPDFLDKVNWIAFVSDQCQTFEEGTDQPATSLYVANLEPIENRGNIIRRATFNLSSDFSPTVLTDGRLLFASRQVWWHQEDTEGKYILLATSWDGTGQNLFLDYRQGAHLKVQPVELPDRSVVFVESEGLSDGQTNLARVFLRRPLGTYEQLNRNSGAYSNPFVFSDGALAVSYASGEESFGIYLFDLETGLPGRKLFDDPKWDDLEAQAIVPRVEPQGLVSSIVDTLDWAELHCLNIYDSDQPEILALKKGAVKRVRLVEGIPAPRKSGRRVQKEQTQAGLRILGEAPVEPDGSFWVRIPGDVPFSIQVLDGEGTVLHTMPRWMWVGRGTSRGCIGCHENKELSPENMVSQAVYRAKPHVLMAPPEQRPALDLTGSLAPIIQGRQERSSQR
jgi:hypothetical protein